MCVCLWTQRERKKKKEKKGGNICEREIKKKVCVCDYKTLYKVPTAVTFNLFRMLLYVGMCISRIWCSGAPEGVKCVCLRV